MAPADLARSAAPVREATAICRAYLPAVVARSGLPATLVQRLTEDVQDPHALVEIGALARALSTVPIMEGLAPGGPGHRAGGPDGGDVPRPP